MDTLLLLRHDKIQHSNINVELFQNYVDLQMQRDYYVSMAKESTAIVNHLSNETKTPYVKISVQHKLMQLQQTQQQQNQAAHNKN